MTKPGFIQHPWSHQRGDSLRTASVIQRIEKEAMRGCGLYYEIYHHCVISQLLLLLSTLSTTDRLTLTEEANRRGFNLDETSIEESRQSYQEILTEIRHSEY
ncbi:hypothetical plasmid protein [Pectobacterium atrosepticum SCRI1043]|uniref:Hypothetical plasmid protein n=1 Tax=Pectobacterium atrosepticum (strain SCRI 1043 / ATCC BAA-672) TaxID=218491 RepID=Q6D6S0_PECAS|nr:hypothetical protein [Pectobacterium atrosepticum]MCL6316350.1 hypothetical protein [Pectobacterium atrosepticum]MCL6319414.1 hypothetical protein [Pectobacterium atrosepticum]CAG74515.1 hypothetical plasmid protein [Pectobacterium atrosepticum SCRI1043]